MYNTLVPNGYNLREGGNGGKHSEETKKKISESLKNRTDIIRNKPQLGKPHTDEVKLKISNSLKNKPKKTETIKLININLIKYKIFQINNEGIIINTFNGYNEASKNIGTSTCAIWNACNGKCKTIKGFIWKSELINLSIENL